MLALALIATFNLVALLAPDPALALAARLLIGVGTGLGFIAGSAYVRSKSGSAFAQGLYGGVALGGGGLALALVPAAAGWIGWRAPFATAVALALAGLALLAYGPADGPRHRHAREEHIPTGVLRDVRLYKLAVLFSCSLGLSVVLGNWVVTLLQREGGMSRGAAGVIAALTLVLGVVSRPLGGWILHAHPGRVRAAVGASLVTGALGSLAVAAAAPPALTVLGAMLIGLAAGIPFAPVFQGAARLRPDAQAASIGLVNGSASAVILVGTPLLGLAFSLPGGGRAGFVAVAVLWAARPAAAPERRSAGSRRQTRARIAFRMMSAASAASAGSASSSGEWLTPSRQGTKTIAQGTWSATHIVSCAAPDAISMKGSPVERAASSSAATMRASRRRRREGLALVHLGRHLPLLRGVLHECRDVPGDAAVDLLVDAADVEGEANALRDHVDQARMHLDLADRADRALPCGAHEPLELEDRVGERQPGVEPEVHRRRTRVVAAAVHGRVGVHIAGDRRHDPDPVPRVLQHACLLDVHLDPTREVVEDVQRLAPERPARSRPPRACSQKLRPSSIARKRSRKSSSVTRWAMILLPSSICPKPEPSSSRKEISCSGRPSPSSSFSRHTSSAVTTPIVPSYLPPLRFESQ